MPVEARGLRPAEKNRPGRSGRGYHSGLTWGRPASRFLPLEQVGVAALFFSLPRHPLVCAFPNAFTFMVIDLKITGQLIFSRLSYSHLLSGRLSFSCMNVTSSSIRKLTSLIQNRKISVTEMPNCKHERKLLLGKINIHPDVFPKARTDQIGRARRLRYVRFE